MKRRWDPLVANAYHSTSDVTKRLALALSPIRSVIRVIDDTSPPMTVEWAAEGRDEAGNARSISATQMSKGHIVINPLPVVQDHPRALQICTSFAMHEASHAKHSREVWRDMIVTRNGREEPAFSPMRICLWLWNLIEDPRIEDCTGKDWPGFRPYFSELVDYLWDEMDDKSASYGPTLQDKLKVVFLSCRFGEQIASWDKIDWADERDWWQAWQADYHAGLDVKTTIERALAHLAEDEQTAQELQKMADAEQEMREAGEKLRQQIERLIKEGIEGLGEPCVLGDMEHNHLSEDAAEEVERLVREGLIETRPIIVAEGAANPNTLVRKPTESSASLRKYIGRPDPATEALRTALVFRPSLPRWDIKLQKTGTIDEEELYRFGMGDMRVFSERVIEHRPDVLMGLLVDMSGSMDDGYKLQNAQRLAQLFVYALHDQEGVTVKVWGHTGNADGEGTSSTYRLWEPGDPMTRLGLISALPHINNYDGHAIAWCVNEMEDDIAPQKVLIVLSDGLPSANGYGGTKAIAHVRAVTDRARHRGIPVIQIAIDDDLRPVQQAQMFGDLVVPFRDTNTLPRQLAKVIGRYA